MEAKLLRPYLRILLIMMGFCFVMGVPIVFAHSDLVNMSPAIGDVWDYPPALVTLLFDEELSSNDSTVQIFNKAGVQVDNGDGGVDLNDIEHKTLRVTLPQELEKGAYTVRWTAVSAEDGDETNGAYAFGIGAGTVVRQPQARGENSGQLPKELLGIVLVLFLVVILGFVIRFHGNKRDEPILRRPTKTTQT